MTEIPLQKSRLREEMSLARSGIAEKSPGAPREAASHALSELAQIRGVTRVAAYLSIRSEIDTGPLLLALHGLGCELCVPVVDGKGLPLSFRPWSPETRLVRGAFGVPVPPEGDPVEPQVLFVPLMAYDGEGYRLGYGGGFYDRTIARLRQAGDVRAFGFAFSGQRVKKVPRDITDARLDGIVSETGCLRPGDTPQG